MADEMRKQTEQMFFFCLKDATYLKHAEPKQWEQGVKLGSADSTKM